MNPREPKELHVAIILAASCAFSATACILCNAPLVGFVLASLGAFTGISGILCDQDI